MDSNIELKYKNFPKLIDSADIHISEDKSITLSFNTENDPKIVIYVKDSSFGVDYQSALEMDYKTALDYYRVLQQLLKQFKESNGHAYI